MTRCVPETLRLKLPKQLAENNPTQKAAIEDTKVSHGERITHSEDAIRDREVIITGHPISSCEDLTIIVEKIGVLRGSKLLKRQIKDISRIPSKAQTQPKPIIARLSNATTRFGLIPSTIKNKKSLMVHNIDSNLEKGADHVNQN